MSQTQMQTKGTDTEVSNCITLKGSTDIIVEFFQYSINSILYQRGVYPPEKFTATKHYNLQMMVTTDKHLQSYLNQVLFQLQNWLLNGNIERLVLVIASQENESVLERWQFNIEKIDKNNNNNNNNHCINQMHDDNDIEMKCDNSNNKNNNNNNFRNENCKNASNTNINPFAMGMNNNNNNNNKKKGKALKEITREIQAIIRQITSSVTFLPLLEGPCSFDLLFYTDKECKVPKKWELSDPRFITNSADVVLRSFDTSIHKVDSMVSYKVADDDDDDDDEL